MQRSICLTFSCAVLVFAAQAQEGAKTMTAAEALALAKVEIPKNMPEHHADLRRLGALLVDREYEALEAIANEYRESKERWGYGWWKIDSFYNGCAFGKYQVKYHLQTVPYLERFDGWLEAYPQSITARIAEANVRTHLAWRNRGGGWAYEVSEEGWAGMRRHLEKAWALLEEAEQIDPSDPELYTEWIRVANGLGKSKSTVEELYEKGLAVDAGYPHLYMARAWYLMPRWHGDRGDLEAFAEQAAEDSAAVPGTGAYAWIAYQIYTSTSIPTFIHRFEFSPKLLSEGFDDVLSEYPNWPWIQNLRARLCSLVEDKETAKKAFAAIGRDFDDSVWPDKFAYGRWKRWAENDAEWPGGNRLHYAVRWDDVNLCRAYLAAGEDIEGTDESGLTPFHYAAKLGKIEAARFLINEGIDIMDGGKSMVPPIVTAAQAGRTKMVQLLLDLGADPNARSKLHGNAPLITAAANSRKEVVELLLNHPEIEINIQDKKGQSPIYFAADRASMGVIKLLIEAGVDVNLRSNTGQTPLYWARKKNRKNAIKLLEAAGATL